MESNKTQTTILGVILIVFSTVCSGSRFAVEEKIMKSHNLDPFYVIGMEGVFGTLMGVIIIVIFNFITCEGQLCPHGFLASA